MTTIFTARQFDQDTSGAKKAAGSGPVFITDRSYPTHVLITYENYKRLIGTRPSIVDLLAMRSVEDISFNPGTAGDFPAAADLI